MRLYIVRHGETDANAQGIVQGWLDTELNKKGLAQAVDTASDFSKPVDAIYSSDLKRAMRTAQEFRDHYVDVPYFEDRRLRERNFGDAAGTHRDNHDWEQFWSIEDRSTIPNAEIINDFTMRVKDFLDELKTKPYASVLVVTHGGVLNRIQTILDPNHQHYSHENTSILEIDI
ncbi:MAG TPA: histidine phosphatase family protein [Candidatus Microsaccharimonas sp.]|jgi:probable phosphoglycerate mutase